MIYEERRTLLHRDDLPAYVALCQETVWPALEASHGRVLCLLGGLIGDPLHAVLQMTAFADVDTWQAAQPDFSTKRHAFIEHEDVRLLRPVASRPKVEVPSEDRRAVYGYRRNVIIPTDLDEWVRCSEEGVWPRIESQRACILGLWTTVATTAPCEVILLTGYHSPAHWQETRDTGPRPPDMDAAVWHRSHELLARRRAITQRTWVHLMRALWPQPA